MEPGSPQEEQWEPGSNGGKDIKTVGAGAGTDLTEDMWL